MEEAHGARRAPSGPLLPPVPSRARLRAVPAGQSSQMAGSAGTRATPSPRPSPGGRGRQSPLPRGEVGPGLRRRVRAVLGLRQAPPGAGRRAGLRPTPPPPRVTEVTDWPNFAQLSPESHPRLLHALWRGFVEYGSLQSLRSLRSLRSPGYHGDALPRPEASGAPAPCRCPGGRGRPPARNPEGSQMPRARRTPAPRRCPGGRGRPPARNPWGLGSAMPLSEPPSLRSGPVPAIRKCGIPAYASALPGSTSRS